MSAGLLGSPACVAVCCKLLGKACPLASRFSMHSLVVARMVATPVQTAPILRAVGAISVSPANALPTRNTPPANPSMAIPAGSNPPGDSTFNAPSIAPVIALSAPVRNAVNPPLSWARDGCNYCGTSRSTAFSYQRRNALLSSRGRLLDITESYNTISLRAIVPCHPFRG